MKTKEELKKDLKVQEREMKCLLLWTKQKARGGHSYAPDIRATKSMITRIKNKLKQLKIKHTCKYCGTEVESEGLACETCCVRGKNLPYGGRLD